MYLESVQEARDSDEDRISISESNLLDIADLKVENYFKMITQKTEMQQIENQSFLNESVNEPTQQHKIIIEIKNWENPL